MKDTGVIRRIDELGRIVIPKELRRAYRIKEGDTLEIYTENDALVLKKSAEIMCFEGLAESFVKTLVEECERTVLVCDTDKVVLSRGERAKEYLGKNLSDSVIKLLKDRLRVTDKRSELMQVVENEKEERAIVCPIIRSGDAIGLFILLVSEFEHRREELVALTRFAATLFSELVE